MTTLKLRYYITTTAGCLQPRGALACLMMLAVALIALTTVFGAGAAAQESGPSLGYGYTRGDGSNGNIGARDPNSMGHGDLYGYDKGYDIGGYRDVGGYPRDGGYKDVGAFREGYLGTLDTKGSDTVDGYYGTTGVYPEERLGWHVYALAALAVVLLRWRTFAESGRVGWSVVKQTAADHWLYLEDEWKAGAGLVKIARRLALLGSAPAAAGAWTFLGAADLHHSLQSWWQGLRF